MKKILALMLAAAMALSLAACGGGNGDKESAEASTASPYADLESCAEYAIDELKSVLKNPSSLTVNNLYAVVADDGYIFDIDYSAENGLGGANRDDFFISVYSVENGFAVLTYGSGSFQDTENQMYSSQFYDKYNKVAGAYIFDPETLTVLGIDESGIDPYIDQRVELTGKMKGEKDASTGFGGAWDFELENDSFLKVVYFAEGTDLDWYKQFTGLPYEITISAIKDENGHYREAEIVEDTIRNATYAERVQRFSYHDIKILADTLPTSGIDPMNADDIQAVLTDTTFSLSGKTYTITFHADGIVDATYMSMGEERSMYESWRMEDGHVICVHSFTNKSGESVTKEVCFTPYQFDETYLLFDTEDGLSSMALTPP